MEILIKRHEGNIIKATDFTDIEGRGEIAHIICELELIKNQLLELWNEEGNE